MILSLAVRNLFRNVRRTIAVLLTVLVGCASLMIFKGFSTGIVARHRDSMIHARYGHGQLNLRGYRDQVLEQPWTRWITNWETLRAQLLKEPEVAQVFPRVEFFSLLTNGKITVSGKGQGIDGAAEEGFFNALNIEDGKSLSNEPDGILLGAGLARALDVKAGGRVTLLLNTVQGSMNAGDFGVTGVFRTGVKEFDDAFFRIQLTQAHKLLDTDRVESISLALRQDDRWSSFASAFEQGHPELEAVPFEVLDKVYYQNSVDWLDAQFAVIQIIIVLVIILGIFNSISTGIMERKPEIGNLRANGESSLDVLKLLGAEGLVLGVLGSALGLALAFLLTHSALRSGILMPPPPALTLPMRVMIELRPGQAAITFGLGVASVMIATLVAGWRASRMPLGKLMRSH